MKGNLKGKRYSWNPPSSIWHYVQNVKSTVKILSIFVAFLENVNFTVLIYTVPLGMPHGAGVLILSKKSKAKERNIWVLSPLVHLKRREKYISFSQLVLFSLYFFWGKCVYFSIFRMIEFTTMSKKHQRGEFYHSKIEK